MSDDDDVDVSLLFLTGVMSATRSRADGASRDDGIDGNRSRLTPW